MTDLVSRLRAHVTDRGGNVLENGAWKMMLDAADEIERLRGACRIARGNAELIRLAPERRHTTLVLDAALGRVAS